MSIFGGLAMGLGKGLAANQELAREQEAQQEKDRRAAAKELKASTILEFQKRGILKIITDPNLRSAMDADVLTPAQVFTSQMAINTAKPSERKIIEQNGVNYYLDTGEEVLPNATPASQKLTTEQKNFQAAQNNPAFADYQKLQSATGDEFGKIKDKNEANNLNDDVQNGYQARRAKGQIDALAGLLKNIGTGRGAAIQNYAGRYGINTEGLDDVQAANAIISQLVPAQRPPGSGTMSDADLALFKASLPQLLNTPDGNAKIIAVMQGMSEYDIQMGQIAQDILHGNISRTDGAEKMFNMPHPLAAFVATLTDAPIVNNQTDAQTDVMPEGMDPAIWDIATPAEKRLFIDQQQGAASQSSSVNKTNSGVSWEFK